MTSCCFTGHRSYKLQGYDIDDLKIKLKKQIVELIDLGVFDYYTGMAEGVDLMAAKIVLDMKGRDPRLFLHAAIPYPGQPSRLSKVNKLFYDEILSKCESADIISNSYHYGCFQKRNEFMVDNSEYIIAVSCGVASGTENTIKYAKAHNKTIFKIPLKKL